MGLKSVVFRQFVWALSELLFSQVFQLLFRIILARLLFPEDFGLVAMALVLTQGLMVILNLGISNAIIQRKSIELKSVSSMFWAELIWGLLLFVLAFFSATKMASFFGDARIILIIRVLALGLVFSSMSILPMALLEKNLRFFKRFISNVLSIVAFGIIAIVLALFNKGYWSLVIGQVAQAAVQCGLFWFWARPNIFAGFSLKEFFSLFSFGKHIMFVNVMAFGLSYVDNLVVGRVLGSAVLGMYAMAFSTAEIPVRGIHMLNSVFYSLYSKLQTDFVRLRKGLNMSLTFCLLYMLPLCIMVLLLGDTLVSWVLGEKWLPISHLLKIFMVYGIFRAAAGVFGFALLAINRPRAISFIQLIELFIVLVTIYPVTVYFGAVGVTLLMTVQRVIGFILYFVMARSAGLYSMKLLFSHSRILVWGTVMMVSMWTMQQSLPQSVNTVLSLLTGILMYVLCIFFFEKEFVFDLKKEIEIFFGDISHRFDFSRKMLYFLKRIFHF